jgi:hypothetical protein
MCASSSPTIDRTAASWTSNGNEGRDTVRIELGRRQPFRFQKNLMRPLVRKAVDLVLDARAIARADASITPVNIGLRSKPERMISCVRSLVCVIQQDTWRGGDAGPAKLNDGIRPPEASSPGCSSNFEKSIVDRRCGVACRF